MDNYIKNKGILVGKFSEQDLINGIDKVETNKAMKRTGLKYTNTFSKNKGNILEIYVCTVDDMKL